MTRPSIPAAAADTDAFEVTDVMIRVATYVAFGMPIATLAGEAVARCEPDWVDLIAPHATRAVFVVGLIGTGVSSLKMRGRNTLGMLALSGGVLLCFTFTWLALSAEQTFHRIGRVATPRPEAAQRRLRLAMHDEQLPLEKRILASRLYAQHRYEYDGVLVFSLNEEGTPEPYRPTKEDREARESLLRLQCISEAGITAMRRAALGWPAAGLFGVALGVLWANWHERR